MAKKNYATQNDKKVALGTCICKLRKDKGFSLRDFAKMIDLAPSNLSYLERGVNVPTAEVYQKILDILNPIGSHRKDLDELFTSIRNAPPPDVCGVLLKNYELGEKLRILDNVKLSPQQLEKVEELFLSFKSC